VRAVSGGFCSNFIHGLRPGDSIEVEGPYGDFQLADGSQRDVLFAQSFMGLRSMVAWWILRYEEA